LTPAPPPGPAVTSFVDHHVHLLRVAAGVVPRGGLGSTPEGIADYHRRVAAAGSSPMDDPPGEPAAEDLGGALRAGLQRAADLGLVGVTEAGMSDWRHWDALVAERSSAPLPCAVRILVASGAVDLERMASARAEADRSLAVAGVKFYADGWLGPRTCACSVPFADVEGEDHGILFQDAGRLAERIGPVAEAGWGIATHAIGDRAIEAALDAYETVFGGAAGVRAAAPRVEHAQLLRPELIARMADLGVVACIQPCFATSDAESIALALAGRFPVAYRWDLLLEAGVRVVAGSDFPIETLDPAIGLERLTTGEHALSEDAALALMTTPLDALWPLAT
jgi:predicted amidohydrolase YtcJ